MLEKAVWAVGIILLSPVIIVQGVGTTIWAVYVKLNHIWYMREIIRASLGTKVLGVLEKVSQSALCHVIGRPILRVCGIKNLDLGTGVFRFLVPVRHLMPHEEWAIDYPWFLSNLAGNRICDTGFITHNWFTRILCQRGHEVVGVDCNDWAYPWWSRRFSYIKADLTDPLPFVDTYFDIVVSPSLIEHLGLGFYGDKVKDNAAIGTVREFHRILKPSGVVLAEVPFNSTGKLLFWHGQLFQLSYTLEMVRHLFADFKIEELNFARFVGNKGTYDPGLLPKGHWEITDELTASQIDWESGEPPRCIVRIKARKPE